MKTLNRKFSKKLIAIVVFASSLSALAGTVRAEDTDANIQPFAMTVLADRAYGDAILRGRFDRAIDKLTATSKKASKPENASNLCVAYAKNKELDKALDACGVAVAALTSQKVAMDKHAIRYGDLSVSVQTDLSIALSNQGVLFAVKGEHDRARKIFLTAIQLENDRSKAKENLLRLNSIES
jgi:Flp pilus assembly protein TadD